MARNGEGTRAAIMDAAQALILEQGFAATSIDRVIDRAGVAKGAFFYHFPSKADLAHALVERYARQDEALLVDLLARAEELSRDPAQQVIIFVGLMREQMQSLGDPSPGCLFASYCYEAQLFDATVHEVIRGNLRLWRERLAAKLRQAAKRRPPRLPVDFDSVADLLTGIIEGAYILSRALEDRRMLSEQLLHYRNYLELLFAEH